MKNLIKVIFFAAAFANTVFAATPLRSTEAIIKTLMKGDFIRVRINLSQCQSESAINVSHEAIIEPHAIQLKSANSIAFSTNHFTLNNPALKNKPVYEHVSYQLKNNDILKMDYTPLSAIDFEPLMTTQSIYCTLNTGAIFYKKG